MSARRDSCGYNQIYQPGFRMPVLQGARAESDMNGHKLFDRQWCSQEKGHWHMLCLESLVGFSAVCPGCLQLPVPLG